jgi:hypothetical protein
LRYLSEIAASGSSMKGIPKGQSAENGINHWTELLISGHPSADR